MFCSPAESMCHVVMVLDFCALKAQKGRRENSRKTLGLSPISAHVHLQGVLILLEVFRLWLRPANANICLIM